MGPTAYHRTAACAACMVATATAILLWGVGAESVYFSNYLQGGLLLADALLVTLLECLTVWQYLEWRCTRYQMQPEKQSPCRLPPRLIAAVDMCSRAVAYALLSVPCFVRVRRIWLPLVPGVMLLLSAVMYLVKYCCALKRQRSIVKVPTFVRFKDESAIAESQAQMEPRLSHQSSFTSTNSACSVQMGSKDSGIEASQRDVAHATPAVAAAAAAASAAVKTSAANAAAASAEKAKQSPGRKARGLVRAYSSSPDKCCLISDDDCLSLRD